jgi:hypothetical protein
MIQRTKGKTAVVGWGRGMGHKGHMLLASAVIHQAKAINATPIFILSRTSLIDPNTGDLWSDTKKVRATKDDPLTPQEKLAIYQKTFPEMAKIFTVADGESGSLNDALANLAKQGFTNVVLVVGADQKAAFQYLVNPSKDGSIPYQQMGLQNLVVMSRQETQAPGSDIEGPRATPMRQVLLDPKVSDEQKFAVWRDAMPDALDDREVFDLMQRAQQRLGRAEQVAPPKTPKAKIKEFIQRVRPMLKEASVEKKIQVLKLLKEAYVREFDASDYKQRYTLYTGDEYNTYKVDTFSDLDDAIEEVSFLRDADPSTLTSYWQIRDINNEVVWNYDPNEAYDAMRRGNKIQFRKPDDLTEFLNDRNSGDDDLSDLKEAMENWQTMYADASDIATILNHPYSQQFKQPPAGIQSLYRGLMLKGRSLKAVSGKSNRKLVAYATNPAGAETFLASLDLPDEQQIMIEKQFNPGDFLLDYTALYESVFAEELGPYSRYEPEYEVWMRATPYYTSIKEEEIVNQNSIDENGVNEAEAPFELENRNALDYGMRKTMIHRLAKATDYEISALSLASDEELSDLYQQVFPEQDVSEDYLDEK